MDTETSTIRQGRSDRKYLRHQNLKYAISLLNKASEALRSAQEMTYALGENTTDCGDAARRVDEMLSSDGGDAGLAALLRSYPQE